MVTFWNCLADYYIRSGLFDRARDIYEEAITTVMTGYRLYSATQVPYTEVDDLASVWCEWAEMDIKPQSIKAVYDRIIDLRIATPQVIIIMACFLKKTIILKKHLKLMKKGGTKLERARDLFEQCLEHCPQKFAKPIYLLYAKLEKEEHGLTRHAMAVYNRATKAVLPEEQFEMFNIYLKKAAEIYGVTHTREIYQQAIDALPDGQAKQMCLKFADLEQKLGEIDRARAIYSTAVKCVILGTNPDFGKHGKNLNAWSRERDSMQNLEAQAKLLAFETPNEVALNRSKVMFVRGEATDEEDLEHIETNNLMKLIWMTVMMMMMTKS
ncbi:pre-mRNA-splicing factor SYF1 [Caerostris extrusa]|uniref:Pre-mRNA-splicing factor SYF1 n=1 Tax=Caerostris extrusa TaxID=172846 RepID=A0AAV4RJU4_CAEEX|nr:pre-mRNA-splicing factor SYF1 [Caerostris extrusa]